MPERIWKLTKNNITFQFLQSFSLTFPYFEEKRRVVFSLIDFRMYYSKHFVQLLRTDFLDCQLYTILKIGSFGTLSCTQQLFLIRISFMHYSDAFLLPLLKDIIFYRQVMVWKGTSTYVKGRIYIFFYLLATLKFSWGY